MQKHSFSPWSALLLLAPTVSAQTQIDSVSGSPTSEFGTCAAFVGDLDGDGHDEWVVGAPGDDSTAVDAGRATVFDGASGAVVFTFDGANGLAQLGNCVDGAGDIDGDGTPDIVIGSPGGLGRVLVASGADGSTLFDIAGAAPAGDFGELVAGVGDMNQDGRDDFAATKRLDVGAGLYVYSGMTGTLLFHAPWDFIGSIDGAGDVNGDGFDDVVAGNPWVSTLFSQEGAVRVYLGPAGAPGLDIDGDVQCLQYGRSVAGVGDMNGDGKDDILVGGTAEACFAAFSLGRMDLLAGDTGALLRRWEGGGDFTRFGTSVCAAGDVDRDGVMDVATIEPLWVTPAVKVYSGASGDLIDEFHGGLGYNPPLAAAGDVDGDGFPDFLVGDPDEASDTGEVTIWTLGCPENAGYNYCTAAPNSAGPGAVMGYTNTPDIAANNLRLLATGCPPQTFGIFFYGQTAIEVPFGEGFRCVGGTIFRLTIVNTGANGTPTYQLDITNPPRPTGQISAGSTWFFQFWHRDNVGMGPVFNLSDGMRITFCP